MTTASPVAVPLQVFADAAVWAVGRFPGPDGPVLWPSTRAERASAAAFAERRLASLGIAAGDRVLLVSLMSDGVQMVPIEDALGRLGAVLTPADATEADAGRVASVIERARPTAILGLNRATLDGLDGLGHPRSLLSRSRLLVADEEAAGLLEREGLSPLRWLRLGPALAMECGERAGPHVDGRAWHPVDLEGEVVLVPRLPDHGTAGRAGTPSAEVRTGVRAAIQTSRCGCGSDEPRVVLEEVGAS